ncbi:MAG: hypothetical protein ACFB9M_14045 [Myxococcota bacterium]
MKEIEGLAERPGTREHPGVEVERERFPCTRCGAYLEFSPGASALTCGYCGHRQDVRPDESSTIREHDFREGLARAREMNARELARDGVEVDCASCGARSVMEGQAGRCPFCDSPVVLHQGDDILIQPESLLPFAVSQGAAGRSFRSWLRKLWFAPGDLKKQAAGRGLDGVYLPYWTYDAHTISRYSGRRGDYYYVMETFTDSKGKRRRRRVRRTRWSSAGGMVTVHFDDTLICASTKVPRWILRKLEPWDLPELTPWDQRYLSGFTALRYDVDLQFGFNLAKERMEPTIRTAVRRDIGGDEQQITRLDVQYGEVSFKHLLLPVWISSFRYRDRVYRFVVNARTGEVAGERPWSKWKIVVAVLMGLLVVAMLVLLRQAYG